MFSRRSLALGVLALCVASGFRPAVASVVITGTRLVYPANQQEVTVKLDNEGAAPALVQAWIDSGDMAASPAAAQAPFVILPPVFRVDPGKGQSLRILFSGAPLPAGRESVFWLNVLEIPPSGDLTPNHGQLQMAFRSRLKLFYRPEGLEGSPIRAMEHLQWRLVPVGKGYVLRAYNPTAFHVSMVDLALVDGAKRYDSAPGMVAPQTTHDFALTGLNSKPSGAAYLEASALNDLGALVVLKPELQR